MARVSDSMDSIIRGVSQQVPHDRLIGQHWAQDNFISDPVRGLARRHGSVQKDAVDILQPIGPHAMDDAAARNEQTVFAGGVEYSFLYRPRAFPGSMLHPLAVINKDRQKFVNVVATDAALAVLGEGISSITAAGHYILMSSATRPVTHDKVDNMAPSRNQHVVWMRGGANSRTFTIYATVGGVEKKYEYKTMGAYYDGKLDTSDIPVDGNYGKNVNDRVNAYNTKVNQHISEVAKDITPANIAAKLAELMKVDIPDVTSDGPYVKIPNLDSPVTTDDGGNGEYMRAVSREVTLSELVSPRHYPGKIIKVVPKQANSLAYYLKAEPVVEGSTEFGEVVWRETAGVGVNVTWAFLVGALKENVLYIGASSQELSTLTGFEVPELSSASCGDKDSSPVPEFLDKVIHYMRMFQDRLMIITGSTVFLSKSSDYFNWFRKSVLTLADDDPIEVYAQGTEDDMITTGVQHDRNVILCGQRYQYMVPGRENMTPRNPYIGVQATYEGANLTAHSVAGSLLFFCQRREKRLTLQQMSPGAVADRLDAFDISAQLDGYLTGTPKQIIAMTAPGAVFVRTEELRNGFYVYSYLDSNDQTERLFDSWSRWTFDTSLGTLMGISADDSGLLAVTVRETSTGPQLVLDRFVRETAPSYFPYLDSLQLASDSTHLSGTFSVAFDAGTDRHLLGGPGEIRGQLEIQFPNDIQSLWAGTRYDSSVILTSPYIRDGQDKIILDARLTISKLLVSVSNTAAMVADVSYDRMKTWRTTTTWSYRAAGEWVLNTQGIAEEANVPIAVMKENKAYRMRLSSRSWLPLTIAVVEWAGQAFTSRR